MTVREDSASRGGLLVVDKPAGPTSHDVVALVRRLTGSRRVGHAGTLDPAATGVLVLGIERATRLLGHLMLTEKAYDATVRLGASTTSDDAAGEVTATADAGSVTAEAVFAAAAGFVGDFEQVPPAVSAIKVGGRRAYARTRAGERVELAARPVTVSALRVTGLRRDGPFLDVAIAVRCSSGTYVRALARDLGARLGVGGHLAALRRTAVGGFTLAEARLLDRLESPLPLLSLEIAAERSFPRVSVHDDEARDVCFGRRLHLRLPHPGPVAVFGPDGRFLALYRQEGARAVPVAVFSG